MSKPPKGKAVQKCTEPGLQKESYGNVRISSADKIRHPSRISLNLYNEIKTNLNPDRVLRLSEVKQNKVNEPSS